MPYGSICCCRLAQSASLLHHTVSHHQSLFHSKHKAISYVCMQTPVTVPYDRSLRPQTTYLPFNNINNYGPIDIRVADNYTGNQPSQVCRKIKVIGSTCAPTPLHLIGRCPQHI